MLGALGDSDCASGKWVLMVNRQLDHDEESHPHQVALENPHLSCSSTVGGNLQMPLANLGRIYVEDPQDGVMRVPRLFVRLPLF